MFNNSPNPFRVGVSDADFMKTINRICVNFFGKIHTLLAEQRALILHIYAEQRFGNKETFVIRVYSQDVKNIFTQQFFVPEYRLSQFIGKQLEVNNIQDQINVMKHKRGKNRSLYQNNDIHNLHAHGEKVANEMKQLRKKLEKAEQAFEESKPMTEEQMINKILGVIERQFNCGIDELSSDGKFFAFKISL